MARDLPISTLAREIAEQPDVIEDLVAGRSTETRRIATSIAKAAHITIAARGSSDNAATYGKYLFEGEAGIVTSLAAPSLVTRYRRAPSFARGAVIGISQSGAAPDVAAVLRAGRADRAFTLAITNGARSSVARSAKAVFDLGTGPERSVAATKTYTATCTALALIASATARARRRRGFVFDELSLTVLEGVATAEDADRIARRIGGAGEIVVLGRGYCYAAALEAALKIKELARVWAQPYSSADFAHGPIALIRKGTPVLLFASSGATASEARRTIREIARRGGRVFAVTDDDGVAADAHDAAVLATKLPEPLAPIALVVAAQHLARFLAERRGLDPDRPAGLTKVTRTR